MFVLAKRVKLYVHLILQDMPPLDYWASKPWNQESEVPIHDMLCVQKGENHKSRMTMLGNIVVPAQAFLAFSTLARMVKGQYDM